MRRGLAALVAGALLVATAGALPAIAKKKRVATEVGVASGEVLGSNVVSVAGQLVTKRPCLADREVTVTHAAVKGGTYSSFGTDVTDAEGNWEVAGSAPNTSHFKVTVERKNVGKIICRQGNDEGFFT